MTLAMLCESVHPFRISIQKSETMSGMNYGIYDGHDVFVSPAVWSLLHDESVADQTCRKLPLKYLPRVDFLKLDYQAFGTA